MFKYIIAAALAATTFVAQAVTLTPVKAVGFFKHGDIRVVFFDQQRDCPDGWKWGAVAGTTWNAQSLCYQIQPDGTYFVVDDVGVTGHIPGDQVTAQPDI